MFLRRLARWRSVQKSPRAQSWKRLPCEVVGRPPTRPLGDWAWAWVRQAVSWALVYHRPLPAVTLLPGRRKFPGLLSSREPELSGNRQEGNTRRRPGWAASEF